MSQYQKVAFERGNPNPHIVHLHAFLDPQNLCLCSILQKCKLWHYIMSCSLPKIFLFKELFSNSRDAHLVVTEVVMNKITNIWISYTLRLAVSILQ